VKPASPHRSRKAEGRQAKNLEQDGDPETGPSSNPSTETLKAQHRGEPDRGTRTGVEKDAM
jgi:hypothetical protein